jgi:hypothetical protein
MNSENTGTRFTWTDLNQWIEIGLIRQGQALAIRRHVAALGSVEQQAPTGTEQRAGLNFVTVAYYFGGFMILLAYTFFMGFQWETISRLGQCLAVGCTVGLLWALGYLLRRAGFRLAGGLLIFAGTGIVPLLVYTILHLTGIWPDQPSYDSPAYEDFYLQVKPAWVTMEVASLATAAVLAHRLRFPLITLLVGFWSWYLSMDLARWIFQTPDWSYDEHEQIAGIIMGLLMLAIGLGLQFRTQQDYSRWLYIFGHMVVLGNFSALAHDQEGIAALLYVGLYLTFVAASVWLQRPVFVVFGALGCYGYASYLAYDKFHGSLPFVFTLALMGLTIVLAGVGSQKYVRPWRLRRLSAHQGIPGLESAEVPVAIGATTTTMPAEESN